MRLPVRIHTLLRASAALFALLCSPLQAQPPGTPMPEGIRWGSEIEPEPGVQIRNYRFEPTGENLPYSVYVSSKIKPGEKAPLIVALRGFTGTTLTIVRGTAVDLAEEGGYILVGHSQGGGGARHLAEKYPDIWAAVALQAPAIFDVELTPASRILGLPLLVVVGGKDTLKDGNREFSERVDALGGDVEFRLYEDLDHGTIILGSLREVFSFFGQHARQ